MKLAGKAALIVGGSGGIGRASAQCIAAEGASVMIADINEAGARETISAIEAAGGTAAFVNTNGVDDGANKAAVAETAKQFGGLDILVHSIGGNEGGLTGDSGWHRAIDVFLKSAYYASKYAVAEMQKRGGGAIVNIASIAGVTGSVSGDVEGSGYSCAKHGLIGLSKTMALTYAKDNIRVNVLCPGYFKTDMTSMIHGKGDDGLSYIRDNLRIPMGRWGDPRECGTVAAFLAGPDSSFITGQSIIVDGGFMAR